MQVLGCTEGVESAGVALFAVEGGPLVRESASGEFADWVRPHLAAMAHLAARLAGAADRDDVVQEALARAWRKRGNYDPTKGTPRAWLLAIVADRARRSCGRRREHLQLVEAEGAALPATDAATIDLERALVALPPRMRMAVDCFYFVGLSVAETAVVMGVSDGAVKSALFDARARLRVALEARA